MNTNIILRSVQNQSNYYNWICKTNENSWIFYTFVNNKHVNLQMYIYSLFSHIYLKLSKQYVHCTYIVRCDVYGTRNTVKCTLLLWDKYFEQICQKKDETMIYKNKIKLYS